MTSSFASEVLSIERDGAVATLWLDRPESRNAMGPAFWADLPVAMAELSTDPEVRVLVIAARGPHFSVGLDLKAMGGLLTGEPALGPGDDGSGTGHPAAPSAAARSKSARESIVRMQAAVTSVASCPKPAIAAVHGYCIGGGVDLICACDIRLASADAIFSVREAKVAVVADLGSLQRLPGIIGAGHVAELAFTGKDIGAARAKEIGLVNDVVGDRAALVDAAGAMAAEIAALSPLAVQGTKAVLAANDGRTVTQGLDYVATWNAGMLGSGDLIEAMAAFTEKRQPHFTGN
jgi:enoyl-CoA hydratase